MEKKMHLKFGFISNQNLKENKKLKIFNDSLKPENLEEPIILDEEEISNKGFLHVFSRIFMCEPDSKFSVIW